MTDTLNWQPESALSEQILRLAHQRGQSPENILAEAVRFYLETQPVLPHSVSDSEGDRSIDPLIGMFSGSPDLSTQAEEILSQEITPQSGWTWKAK
jgi:hypothetical protein